MNTNMSSANGNTDGNNGTINGGGIITIITNATLQRLIDSKNEAELAAFEATTGWTWQDACLASIDAAAANLLASKNAAEIAEFEATMGWTWQDAVEMTIEAQIEAQLREISQEASDKSDDDEFERVTGWTFGDAMDMAAERQREIRLFGTRH